MSRVPRYPVYIVSKGRWESRLTVRSLEEMGVPYRIVVEAQEYDDYVSVIDPTKILVLDPEYQRRYDTCDDLGDRKSKGPGPARNFAWDHAIAEGYARHWVMDDNIRGFVRWNNNRRIVVRDAAPLRCIENFVDRYENVAMAGPAERYLPGDFSNPKPFRLNTRIYSCNLVQNNIPFRWRGRYNEDTILSLDLLKAGWCTVLFHAFLQNKTTTQAMRGGNTDEFYDKEGTLAKSRMQVAVHPDVSRLVWRFGRWHHHVDYRPFKSNRLKLKPGVVIPDGPNEYGMRLVRLSDGKPLTAMPEAAD